MSPGAPGPAPAGLLAWPLALLAGLLPCAAALLAWWIATAQGFIPACNVFWDGCTSISRAGRQGIANHVFRSLMMPAAIAQMLCWVLLAHWLRTQLRSADQADRGATAMLPLAVVAGAALLVYASFLGVEGRIYRFLRQYGTVLYFGLTCLNMLLAAGALQRLHEAGVLRLAGWLRRSLSVLAVTLVALGIGNAIVAAAIGGAMKDRVENVTEWWGSLIFVLAFCCLAELWRRQRLCLTLASRP
jgi:uncharacterized protein YqgQ